jgi:alpha-amylase/alpha-mannosidase (GH57 family)
VTRFVCVHGHFYQPPRENPWIDAIDPQPSAAPYHDWNARIAAECYAPNTAARILNHDGRIQTIKNNYAWMSFNVGPTLMYWLAKHDPETYRHIVAADVEGRDRFGGHGPAIAQVYSHLIMPLASARDRRTQVAWGVADFVHHYGRHPEGMWLAEAAVCTDSLEALAEYDIKFTILAPHQASAIRPLGGEAWQLIDEHGIDTTVPYLVKLPSGRTIAVFFYNGHVSRSIAFQGLLNNGESLAQALIDGAPDDGQMRLSHVATDGESYGHHHRHGEMALAYALHHIEHASSARLTVYGEFLELCPPQHEVRIVEQSSWSCAHGVERWRSDCGCHTGGAPGWNQAWRGPLRTAIDWAAAQVEMAWERQARTYFKEPWVARDAYITVINDPRTETIAAFLQRYGRRGVTAYPALGLMELQRQMMQSYTSCAWFFNDAAGIETVQVLRYAARMIQIAEQTLNVSLEEGFHEQLELVRSNTGVTMAEVYNAQVQPLQMNLADICAHYALTALFLETPVDQDVYLHRVQRLHIQRWQLGQMRMTIGVSTITALLTGESRQFLYGVILDGTQILTGGVSPHPERYTTVLKHMTAAVETRNRETVVATMHAELGSFDYSLRSIFRDEQRTVLQRLLKGVVDDVVHRYHLMYSEHASLMRFLQSMSLPLPAELQVAAGMALQVDMRQALATNPPALESLTTLIATAEATGVTLNMVDFRFQIAQALQRMAEQWPPQVHDVQYIERLDQLATIASRYGVDLWVLQNTYNVVWQRDFPTYVEAAHGGDRRAHTWLQAFETLGAQLNMAVAVDMVDIAKG